uniref:Uncharacterized protein n=1 Tax=Rhabditophanes sp. KR3021 TaxID=114890 RepID=A0AC35TGN3_9BILA
MTKNGNSDMASCIKNIDLNAKNNLIDPKLCDSVKSESIERQKKTRLFPITDSFNTLYNKIYELFTTKLQQAQKTQSLAEKKASLSNLLESLETIGLSQKEVGFSLFGLNYIINDYRSSEYKTENNSYNIINNIGFTRIEDEEFEATFTDLMKELKCVIMDLTIELKCVSFNRLPTDDDTQAKRNLSSMVNKVTKIPSGKTLTDLVSQFEELKPDYVTFDMLYRIFLKDANYKSAAKAFSRLKEGKQPTKFIGITLARVILAVNQAENKRFFWDLIDEICPEKKRKVSRDSDSM